MKLFKWYKVSYLHKIRDYNKELRWNLKYIEVETTEILRLVKVTNKCLWFINYDNPDKLIKLEREKVLKFVDIEI